MMTLNSLAIGASSGILRHDVSPIVPSILLNSSPVCYSPSSCRTTARSHRHEVIVCSRTHILDVQREYRLGSSGRREEFDFKPVVVRRPRPLPPDRLC